MDIRVTRTIRGHRGAAKCAKCAFTRTRPACQAVDFVGKSMATIRNLQSTLNLYIDVQNDLLTGKIACYQIGDRTVSLQNMRELENIIQALESAATANIQLYHYMGGNGPGWNGGRY